MQQWVIGTTLCLIGCVSANIGLLMQKLAMTQRPDVSGWKQPRWLVGISLFLSAQIVSLFALSMTPQSMIGALSGLSLVSNSFFAPLLLGERYTRLHLISTVFLTIGSVAVVLFAVKPSDDENSSDLTISAFYDLLWRPEIISLFAASILTVFLLFIRGRVCTNINDDIIVRSIPGVVRPPCDPFTFALASALIASISITMCKAYAMIFRTEIEKSGNPLNILTFGFVTLVVVGLLCSVASFCVLNSGLRHFEALYIIPMYYSLSLLCQSIIGGVFYNEFTRYDKTHALGFITGVATNVCGVWILSIANTGIKDRSSIRSGEDEVAAMMEPCTLQRTSFSDPNLGGVLVRNSSAIVEDVQDATQPGDPHSDFQRTSKSLRTILKRSFSFDLGQPAHERRLGIDIVDDPRESTTTRLKVNEITGLLADGGTRLMCGKNHFVARQSDGGLNARLNPDDGRHREHSHHPTQRATFDACKTYPIYDRSTNLSTDRQIIDIENRDSKGSIRYDRSEASSGRGNNN